VIYEVSHRTTYRYGQPVSVSHHLLHLTPRLASFQSCRDTAIEMTPAPTVRASSIDYFGNPMTFVTIQQSHVELVLHALSVIEIKDRPVPGAMDTPPWEDVCRRLETDRSPEALEALEFTYGSSYAPVLPGLEDYALRSFARERPLLDAARDLTHRIHEDFRYDPGATTLGTSLAEIFAMRRGVCQDFAHVELACLRAIGLPARYVSGYLLTRPAEGKERLVGADASHAWLSVWISDHGWVDLDPTNDMIPGGEHITVAWGRDYGDVSPVSGVMFGGGAHEVIVNVDVTVVGEPTGDTTHVRAQPPAAFRA
jgi:transglutaminase-like putative cysteine protease